MTEVMIALPFFISDQTEDLWLFLPVDMPQRNTLKGLLMILATAGQATVEIDSCIHPLSQGTLLTLLPSHLLRTVECSADFRCLTLAFQFDAMSDFPYMIPTLVSEKMEQTPSLQLLADEQARLVEWHGAISRHHARTEHPSYSEMLRSLVFVFVAEVSAIYTRHPIKTAITHREELTDGFFRLLHVSIFAHRQTAFYANQLCISSKYLARVIQRVTGHTPSYWIADFTVREAGMLLKSSTLTVTQISEQFNFPSSSFFARYFKRYTGVAPQEYRLRRED